MGEETWDPKIPRSRGSFDLYGLGHVVTNDGPRRIVCADCGAPVEDGIVWHLKPETYAAVYGRETFYIERHIGVKCGCAKKRGLM